MSSLKAIVQHFPHAPGVYRFLNAQGEVLYVGKAVDLKKRVTAYFRSHSAPSLRLKKLLEHTADLQFTVVDSELEALILETNLIKSYRPRYNVLMKDDKNYVYVKVTVQDSFPRVYVTRRLQKDGARYFGPKSSAGGVRRILESLKKIFPYRHCDFFIDLRGTDKPQKRDQAFVEAHRKRCLGPCIVEAPLEDYHRVIDQIIAFFEGKTDLLMNELQVQMAEAAEARAFERAGQIRDRLHLIEQLMETQRVSAPDDFDRDVVGLAIEGGFAYVTLFLFRSGKLLSQENFTLSGVDSQSGAELQESDVLGSFLNQYYAEATSFPNEIFMNVFPPQEAVFEQWISTLAGRPVYVFVPERGKKRELLDLAQQNALSFAKQSQVKWQAGSGQDVAGALAGLKNLLNLSRLPNRVEGYDISHLGGVDTVGSMVVFESGFPKKIDYRHFKLRGVQQKIDDYQALEEVLLRRLRYLQNPLKDFRKPRKKEISQLTALLDAEHLDSRDINPHKTLVLEQRKKILAIGRLKPLGKNVVELSSLWVDPPLRGKMWGQKMVRALLAKQKKGKVYAVVGVPGLVDWYGALGFHEVENVPAELKDKQALCMENCAYTQPTVMVYRFSKGSVDASFSRRPDLLVIDGGRGQLGAAVQALRQSEVDIPVISLAKQEEEIFVPATERSAVGIVSPSGQAYKKGLPFALIRLPRDSGILQFIQRLRDEAHRFALKYQRDLREKRMLV